MVIYSTVWIVWRNMQSEENNQENITLVVADDMIQDFYEMEKINTLCISLIVGLIVFLIFSRKF